VYRLIFDQHPAQTDLTFPSPTATHTCTLSSSLNLTNTHPFPPLLALRLVALSTTRQLSPSIMEVITPKPASDAIIDHPGFKDGHFTLISSDNVRFRLPLLELFAARCVFWHCSH
jgi:hypothetical protein